MQGVRRLSHLRARAAALRMQGVRWYRYLRARAAALHMQGVRRLSHLRARAAAIPMQGVRRLSHLRAWGAAGWLPEMPCQAKSCADLRSCSRTRGQESYLGAVRVVHAHVADYSAVTVLEVVGWRGLCAGWPSQRCGCGSVQCGGGGMLAYSNCDTGTPPQSTVLGSCFLHCTTHMYAAEFENKIQNTNAQ